MRHKSLQILSVGIISAMLLVGCSSTNTETTDTPATAVATSPADSASQTPEDTNDSKTYGQITSIDGTSITVELGTKKEMNKNGNQGGGRGDAAASSSDNANGATPPSGQPEKPSGSDGANAQKGKSFSMLDLTGETKTFSVNDSTTVSINSRGESSTGSISDLQVGDTIAFELASDDSTATTITLQSMGQKGNGNGQGQKQNNQSDPAASETPAS